MTGCGFVPDDCRLGLQQSAINVFSSSPAVSNFSSSTPCSALLHASIPSSCSTILSWTAAWAFEINETLISQGGPLLAYGEPPRDPAALSPYYDNALNTPWGGVLVWIKQNANASLTRAETSQFVCARASDITAGSHVPGAAASFGVARATAALVVVAMSLLML
jgi:hypothetical protein